MALPRAKIGRPRKVKTIIRGQAIVRYNERYWLGSIVRYNERYRLEAIVRYNWPKKTFSRDCTIQSAEKNFFTWLYDTIGWKKLFHAIVRYNRPKKTFSRDCTIQSAEKNFFMRLYDTIDHRHMQRGQNGRFEDWKKRVVSPWFSTRDKAKSSNKTHYGTSEIGHPPRANLHQSE